MKNNMNMNEMQFVNFINTAALKHDLILIGLYLMKFAVALLNLICTMLLYLIAGAKFVIDNVAYDIGFYGGKISKGLKWMKNVAASWLFVEGLIICIYIDLFFSTTLPRFFAMVGKSKVANDIRDAINWRKELYSNTADLEVIALPMQQFAIEDKHAVVVA